MIIGLMGSPGAGKDLIAKFFVENKSFKRFAFADEIKKEYFPTIKITETIFELAKSTKYGEKIRQGLWGYSLDIIEKYGDTYFIDKVIKEIKNYNNVIITDVRTELEKETLEKLNSKILLILRNYKEDLKGKNGCLPGTVIPLGKAILCPIFWNISNSIEETYKELEEFYKEILMDEPDSKI